MLKIDGNGPFHSPFLEEAEKELKRYIDECDISNPDIPVSPGVSGSFETKESNYLD